jgi:peptide/nickel transport system permease protein
LRRWVAPHNPFDLATLELNDARCRPPGSKKASRKYLLGTDDQGRDILSAMMYGARISLVVGCRVGGAVGAGGRGLGLLSGFWAAETRRVLMRVCDVMLSFPAILMALLIAGGRAALFP